MVEPLDREPLDRLERPVELAGQAGQGRERRVGLPLVQRVQRWEDLCHR